MSTTEGASVPAQEDKSEKREEGEGGRAREKVREPLFPDDDPVEEPRTAGTYVWGRGGDGQLGLGETSSMLTPTRVKDLSKHATVSLACGGKHTAAVTDTGDVFTWGWNCSGQLGHGDFTDRAQPAVVKGLALVKVLQHARFVQVAAGKEHTVALTDTGAVYAWGDGSQGQLGTGGRAHQLAPALVLSLHAQRVVKVACGSDHTCALTSGGQVFVWGKSANGRLGLGAGVPDVVDAPQRLRALARHRIADVVCGWSHTMCLTDEGAVYTWGKGQDGQLGHGVAQDEPEPRLVRHFGAHGTRVVALAGGYFHSAALSRRFQLYTWGHNEYGQLGRPAAAAVEALPRLVDRLAAQRIVRVACGSTHTIVVDDSGLMYAFGSGPFGQLGLSERDLSAVLRDAPDDTAEFGVSLAAAVKTRPVPPTPVLSLRHLSVTLIACGWWHSIAYAEEAEPDAAARTSESLLSALTSALPDVSPPPQPLSQSACPTPAPSSSDSPRPPPGPLHPAPSASVPDGLDKLQSSGQSPLKRNVQRSSSAQPDDDDLDELSVPATTATTTTTTSSTTTNLNPVIPGSTVPPPVPPPAPHHGVSNNPLAQSMPAPTKKTSHHHSHLQPPPPPLIGTQRSGSLESQEGTNAEGTNASPHTVTSPSAVKIVVSSDYQKDIAEALSQDAPVQRRPRTLSVPTLNQYVDATPQRAAGGNFFTRLFEAIAPPRSEPFSYRDEKRSAASEAMWLNTIVPQWDRLKGQKKTRALFMEGIPPRVRGAVWKTVIGNHVGMSKELFEIYDRHARQERDMNVENSASRLIDVDLPRTFPSSLFFNRTGPFYQQTMDVLAAWAQYRPDVGYVQGMSHVAGMLVMNMDTYDAFCSFVNMMDDIFFMAFYRMDIDLILCHLRVYNLIFAYNMRELYQHFEAEEVSPNYYLLDWFMTMFTHVLKINAASRVWDGFLVEGEAFLHRAALGIIRRYERQFLATDFEGIVELLRRNPKDISEDELMESIMSITVPQYIMVPLARLHEQYDSSRR